MMEQIDALLGRRTAMRPPSQGETDRLFEDFLIRYTYDANAIEGNPHANRPPMITVSPRSRSS